MLVLRLVPVVSEVVDVMEAEKGVPLSAASPLEDESVSECIELAELEKWEAVELLLRRCIAFTNSKSSPISEKRSTRPLTSPCPNSALGFDSSTCLCKMNLSAPCSSNQIKTTYNEGVVRVMEVGDGVDDALRVSDGEGVADVLEAVQRRRRDPVREVGHHATQKFSDCLVDVLVLVNDGVVLA